MQLDTLTIVLVGFVASVVTGGLGYGFSSITVPVALQFRSARVLNPALVLIELVVNAYSLVVNRAAIKRVFPRVRPMLWGLLPGVVLGGLLLSRMNGSWLKLVTYALLLPLIFLQAGGIRRPLAAEGALSVPFGAGVGFLYSVTTISGPPLAVFFNNQGMVKEDFRTAVAVVRVVESVLTTLVYAWLGLFTMQSASLLGALSPVVLVGIPLGAWAIRRVDADTFRRVCMSFDVWVVGFGLSRVLGELKLVPAPWCYAVMAFAVLLDSWMLLGFFLRRRAVSIQNSLAPRREAHLQLARAD